VCVKNKVTFVRSTAQNFVTVLLADSARGQRPTLARLVRAEQCVRNVREDSVCLQSRGVVVYVPFRAGKCTWGAQEWLPTGQRVTVEGEGEHLQVLFSWMGARSELVSSELPVCRRAGSRDGGGSAAGLVARMLAEW